jgi:hypothetical protein
MAITEKTNNAPLGQARQLGDSLVALKTDSEERH